MRLSQPPQFYLIFPTHVYFSFDRPDDILAYALEHDLLPGDGPFDVERPGEGNMNFVARLRAGDNSIILKQSRPWVEKYPSIEAPKNRILTEIAFYEEIAGIPRLQERMPRLLHQDHERLVAVFEDLGEAADYTTLYADEPDERHIRDDLRILLRWLTALHGIETENRIPNREMRILNHAHIFEIPLDPSGVDPNGITPGLGLAADELRSNAAYIRAVAELGDRYLSDGRALLHGDFYPGSWVRTEGGPMVIDPEFAFHGPAEFDLGVCRAHLLLAGMAPKAADGLFSGASSAIDVDRSLVDGFAGTEIMRRLLGVAQLPLDRTQDEKEALLSLSMELIIGGGL